MESNGIPTKHGDDVMETVEKIRGRSKVKKVEVFDGTISNGYPTVILHTTGWVNDLKLHIKMGEISIISLKRSKQSSAKFRITFRIY